MLYCQKLFYKLSSKTQSWSLHCQASSDNKIVCDYLISKFSFYRNQVKPTSFVSDSSSDEDNVLQSTRNQTPRGTASFNILNGSEDSDDGFEENQDSLVSPKLSKLQSRNSPRSARDNASLPNNSTYLRNISYTNTNQKNISHDADDVSYVKPESKEFQPPRSFSNNVKQQPFRKTKLTKKSRSDDFNMDDLAEQLPKHLRDNLSQMSSTVSFCFFKESLDNIHTVVYIPQFVFI